MSTKSLAEPLVRRWVPKQAHLVQIPSPHPQPRRSERRRSTSAALTSFRGRTGAAKHRGAPTWDDLFELATWEELLALLDENGPDELLRQVRAAEATNPEGRQWPRTKRSDDATAVYWCSLIERL